MPDNTPRSWFAVPAPVAALFRRFPLAVYPANDLPLRSPSRGDTPTLYVFIADDDAPRGRPSFNPSCLKWQVRFDVSLLFPSDMLTIAYTRPPPFRATSS